MLTDSLVRGLRALHRSLRSLPGKASPIVKVVFKKLEFRATISLHLQGFRAGHAAVVALLAVVTAIAMIACNSKLCCVVPQR